MLFLLRQLALEQKELQKTKQLINDCHIRLIKSQNVTVRTKQLEETEKQALLKKSILEKHSRTIWNEIKVRLQEAVNNQVFTKDDIEAIQQHYLDGKSWETIHDLQGIKEIDYRKKIERICSSFVMIPLFSVESNGKRGCF